MKKLIFILFFIILSTCNYAYGQCPVMPDGFVCITQADANKAAQNARDLPAANNKIAVLESALEDEKLNTKEAQEAGRKNSEELKAALVKTQTELADKTGQLIGAESTNVRLTAIIDLLLKMTRKKCMPLSVCIN